MALDDGHKLHTYQRACPTTNGGMQMEAQLEYIPVHIANTFFARSAPICKLSWCLLTKISASELSKKFNKSALLVGCLPVLPVRITREKNYETVYMTFESIYHIYHKP